MDPVETREPPKGSQAQGGWALVGLCLGGLLLALALVEWYREDEGDQGISVAHAPSAPSPGRSRSPRPSKADLSEIEPLPPLDPEADASPHPFGSIVTRLPNGLDLIVVEDHTTPTIAAQVVFRVGAAHDPPGQAGSAHLLEHLMFHGTTRLGTRDWRAEAPHYDELRELTAMLARETDPDERRALEIEIAAAHQEAYRYGLPEETNDLLEALGATKVNAWTSLDATAYVAVLPPEKLLPWAVALSEQLSDPVLRAFVNEREIVHEELAYRQGACSVSWEELRRTLFDGHPYGAALGGTPDDLAAISILSLEEVFERGYGPNNAAVVLVGDLDPAEARQIVEDTFGQWRPRATVGLPTLSPPPLPPGVRHIGSAPDGLLRVGWSLGPLAPGELEALRVLAVALRAQLRSKRDTSGAGVSIHRLRHGTLLVLDVFCDEGTSCEPQVLQAVRAVREGGVTRQQVEAARARAWVEHLQSLEDPRIQADEIVSGWVRGESSQELWLQLKGVRSVTREQVLAMAQRLDLGRYAVQEPGKPQPKPTKSRTKSVQTDVEDQQSSAFYREVMALPVPERPARWRTEEDYTIAAEGGIIAVPNPANTLFQAELTWALGWGDDLALCKAIRAWSESAERWAKGLSGSAVDVALRDCGAERARVRIDGPGELAAFTIQRALGSLATSRLEGNWRWVGGNLSELDRRSLLHGPSVAPTRAALDGLRELSGSEMERSLRRLSSLTPSLAYSGPGTAADLAALLSGPPTQRESTWPLEPPHRSSISLWSRRVGANDVVAVGVGEPYDPSREALYAVYDRWLSELATSHLRRKSGHTYIVRASYQRGRTPGEPNVTVLTANSTRPDLAERVISLLTELPSDRERFERAMSDTLVHAWSDYVHFRDAPAAIASQLAHELPADRQEVIWNGLEDVTWEAFEAFLRDERATPLRVGAHRGSVRRDRLAELGIEVVDEGSTLDGRE